MDFDARTETIGWQRAKADAALDPRGRDVVVVVAKIAFAVSLDGRARLAPVDVYRVGVADPGGGLARPSDLEADSKPGTDVGLVGTAHAPRGTDGRRWRAWLRVGTIAKAIEVTGPRVYTARWGQLDLSDPAPARQPVPLRWDLAHGGRDPATGATEPMNPVGRGFATEPSRLDGQLGPQLEPAADPPSDDGRGARPRAHPCHGTFAPIPAHWEPRRARAGTHDAAWARDRAPVRPVDFDPLHHCWSVPELHAARPLTSDAPVEVGGILEEGLWRFALPRYDVRFESEIDGVRRDRPSHLDAFLIDVDTRTVELTWRTSFVLPTKWERVDRIFVTGVGELSRDVTGVGAPSARGAAA